MTNYSYLLLMFLAVGLVVGWIGINQLHQDHHNKK